VGLMMNDGELIQLLKCSRTVTGDQILTISEKNDMISLVIVDRANLAVIQLDSLNREMRIRRRLKTLVEPVDEQH
jgi:hypothetical protein